MIPAKTKIEIDGITYAVGRLPAPVALKLMLKIAPLMRGMSGVDPQMLIGKKGTAEDRRATTDQAIASMLGGVGELQEETVDWVLAHTLTVVERDLGGGRGWGPVWVSGSLMYEDMTLPTMLKLVGKVLMDNLASFTPALSPTSSGAALPST